MGMSYTVSDFYHTYYDSLKIVAGSGGMSRIIRDCDILDYELLPTLKDKFFHTNFHEGQLVLTTFLYARDNPFAILDAVKHLYLKKTAGLVIRNVLKLPIPESVVRYADARDFPIFLVGSVSASDDSINVSFESMICTIYRRNERLKDIEYVKNVLSAVLERELTPGEIRQHALELNPSFNSQYFCLYRTFDELTASAQIQADIDRYRQEGFVSCEDFICEFRGGILLVKSWEYISHKEKTTLSDAFFGKKVQACAAVHGGVSELHNTLTEFRQALTEAICAARYSAAHHGGYCDYSGLGLYRLIFTCCQNSDMQRFSRSILLPIEEYDLENKTNLRETLKVYIETDCSVPETARRLAQHEQTIRYRLGRIYDITGLDHRSEAAREQLSVAAKIHMANEMLQQGASPSVHEDAVL